jgi:hypothetical protein
MTAADDLRAEFSAARLAMSPPDEALLETLGVAEADVKLLIGLSPAIVCDALYEPGPSGGEAFVSPVLVRDAISPESCDPAITCRWGDIVDLVCWHPRHPGAWALRRGAAEWLGSIEPQYFHPDPVPIRQTVLSWFQHGCTGLVLLTHSRSEKWRVLSECRGGVIAENAAHAAELRRILDRPWPRPRVLIAGQGDRRDAA